MISEYERKKQENIKKNQELLASLGLDKPAFEPKEKRQAKTAGRPKKRKAVETEENDRDAPVPKLQRSDSDTLSEASTPAAGPRRSSRNSGKVVDYNKEIERRPAVPIAYSSGVKTTENEGPMGRESGQRIRNPKVYGHIAGIEVGTWWPTRMGCSVDAIHAPPVGGISGGSKGAHSIALSGGYEDDIDLGYLFTFTGSGGRALRGTKDQPKNLRTAPQSSDQSFDNAFNKMLLRSSETKNPVRVIRGFKGKSKYAPSEGYRYDGLYRVEKASCVFYNSNDDSCVSV